MTYGAEAEGAAAALRFLLLADRPPSESGGLILQLRELAIGAVLDLLDGLTTPERSPRVVAATPTRVREIAESGPKVLVRILEQLPRLDPMRRSMSPLDLLDAGAASPIEQVKGWASVARLMTLAVHELQADPMKEWRIHPAAAWSLVRDAAAATEAIVVLDDGLEAAGLLQELDVHEAAEARRTQRVGAAGVASVAGWMTGDGGWVADWASSETSTHRTPEGVLLLRSPHDLARVQREAAAVVATYLRQGAWEERIRVPMARALALRHLQVCEDLAAGVPERPGAHEVRDYFARSAERWAEVSARLQPLRDLAPASRLSPTDQLLRHQHSEMGRQVRRFAEDGRLRSLDASDWVNVAQSTHVLNVVTAQAIRKTVSPYGSALVAYRPELKMTDPVNAPRPGFAAHRFAKTSRFVRALRALADAEPPSRSEVERSVREELSEVLRRLPSQGPVVRPTPGAGSGGRSGDDWGQRRPQRRGPRA